ncbi:MerR family transcriptional regulator [Thiorhodococcus fuscus]|uniref:MerR family transcriptional regulator n=1 Tax=Thiorhodococcus fuscus TaxID=527200 RepID=A0ABW4Y8P7_9GAMM
MTARTWTIGQVARRFGLARSTLIHYDAIGLLVPSGRSAARYRLYSERDLERLERIRAYRATGLALETIAELLRHEGEGLRPILERRLFAINQEIEQLRDQQRLILRLLQTDARALDTPLVDKALWVSMLRAAGLDDQGMQRWHRAFEGQTPREHEAFLVSLGIAADEIAAIRAWSSEPDPQTPD